MARRWIDSFACCCQCSGKLKRDAARMHAIFLRIAVLLMLLAVTGAVRAAETVSQIRSYLADHRLVVLGEQHGTHETPGFVQELVASYIADHRPLQLALELPTSENAALAAYLQSDGGPLAFGALRASPYWNITPRFHDGRRSEEMLALIDAVRKLSQQGNDIQVFGFDRAAGAGPPKPGARDAAMAEELRERFSALPADGRMLVLTGNVHGMRRQPRYLAYPPMTALLQNLAPYNVRIGAREGNIWGCRPGLGCGRIPLIPYDGPSPRQDGADDRDYDLRVWLPRFTVARMLNAEEAAQQTR
ncbi:calcium-binding protein [Stenotrophomonas sp.]|uniref:calcium-binding protein n=1 Tax=Stenotrophomonas sp. TaxID=69392 RepID=UPI0028AB2583|nr:calcium-binding protein [Stenotrophomonas sp.]